MRQLWRTEQQAVHNKFVETRRNVPLRARVESGVALTDLEVVETDAAVGGRTLLWVEPRSRPDRLETRIGPGDPVRLWWDEPEEPEATLAVVARVARRRLALVVESDFDDQLLDGGFRLDQDEPQTTFRRGQSALRRLAAAKPSEPAGRLRRIVYGDLTRQAGRLSSPIDYFDGELNEAQRAAVEHALVSDDLALIHGPPGTGKTRTLVEVIRQLVAARKRVLAVAASNVAVDNLAERLALANVGVVRLGHPARVSSAVEPRTLDALLQQSDAWKLARKWFDQASELHRTIHRRSHDRQQRREIYREARQLRRDAHKHLQGTQELIVGRAEVICTTAAGADHRLLGGEEIDVVVLDEATQATDPVAWIALLQGKRAVLAGDPKQLPPTVISQEAEPELGRTIFDRVVARDEEAARLLVVQHRMHEHIMAFPNEAMYRGRLAASPVVAHHTLADLGVDDDPTRPPTFVFVDTAGRGWEERRGEDDPSTTNPGHAERAAQEAHKLLERGLHPVDIAVITPYRSQALHLRRLLQDQVDLGLEIDTIDGFQGREKEAVILDLVRSNDRGEIGFLRQERRMNVALTRAKRFLLVIGDSATVGNHPFYAQFLDYVEALDAWTSAW